MKFLRTILLAASVSYIVASPNAVDATSSVARPSVLICTPGFSQVDTVTVDHNGGQAFAAGDLDGDGSADIVASSQVPSQISSLSWWRNDGTGKFARIAIDTSLVAASSVFIRDLDGDGHQDILCSRPYQHMVVWYRNDGHQNFVMRIVDSSYAAGFLGVADLDGDGDLDIFGVGGYLNPVSWWQNDGHLNFTRHALPYFPTGVWMIAAADLNSDGALDLVAAGDSSSEVPWWQNDGSGNFALHAIQGIAYGVSWVEPADINGDGRIDIAGVAYGDGSLQWWENLGDGNFQKRMIAQGQIAAKSICARDLNGDGKVDLAVSNIMYSCTWWENDGTGNFTVHLLPGTFQPGRVIVAHLNGDCAPDIALSEWYGKRIVWWRNECATLPCDCSHHGDVSPDGVFDVFDVIQLIDHVFSGAPQPPIDPACPHLDRGDVNCDRVDDVMDVIYMIDFVFSGGQTPCNPCACP